MIRKYLAISFLTTLTNHLHSPFSKESRKATSAATGSAKNGRASLSGRKKAKVEDDDDFEFDDAGLADEDLGMHKDFFSSSATGELTRLPECRRHDERL